MSGLVSVWGLTCVAVGAGFIWALRGPAWAIPAFLIALLIVLGSKRFASRNEKGPPHHEG